MKGVFAVLNQSYVLVVEHGDYDDHVEYPVCICESEEEAILISEALENRDPHYFEIINPGFTCNDISYEFSIRIDRLPLVKI